MKKQGSRIAENRRGLFNVAVEDTIEAGIVLSGDEIKSIRANRAQLTGAYVRLMYGGKTGMHVLPQVVVVGMHLADAADPTRTRPLLLHKKEVQYLQEQLGAKGRTAIPTRIYMSHGWAKLQIGIGTGRKSHDKRQLLKERDIDREQRAGLKG